MRRRNFGGRRSPSQFGRGRQDAVKSHNGGRKITLQAGRLDVTMFINKSVTIEEKIEYLPQNRFEDFDFSRSLKLNVAKKGYVTPTPIQDQSIPLVIQGRDLVGIANTGTGKTAAFLLPLIDKVLRNRSERVLILAPTRELAQQIRDEFVSFVSGMGIHTALCVGGVSAGPQINDLRRSVNFVIGTPGRVKDLINRRELKLATFRSVVLDEADRMLDMGFIPDIRSILGCLPAERQTLFFSATLPREVEALVGDFLQQPERVSVKVRETAANVHQDIVRIETGKQKIDVLQELLLKVEFQKVLVFGKTKYGVDKIAKRLIAGGFRVASIHGNKTQGKRQQALNEFKANRVQVLIATDVAARGLDIADVSHVINFDLPATYEDYVHRIGRTGRADKRGMALTFV